MNKNHLLEQRSTNNIKTFILLAGITGAILALGYLVAVATGNSNYIWMSLFIAIAQNVASYFFSDRIALSMSGAVPADAQKYSELHEIVASLSSKYDLPKPAVYVINDPAPNAFATGRNAEHSAVAATTGLLAMLNRGELEGVMAHELSHIKNKDILIMSVVVVMASVLSALANFAMHASFVGDNRDKNNNALIMIIGVVASLIIPIAAALVQSSISRKREFMADAGGALLTGYPEGLASALLKISNFKQPMQNANPATAHLYISCPLGGTEHQTFFQKLFMTHPPIAERVAALRGETI